MWLPINRDVINFLQKLKSLKISLHQKAKSVAAVIRADMSGDKSFTAVVTVMCNDERDFKVAVLFKPGLYLLQSGNQLIQIFFQVKSMKQTTVPSHIIDHFIRVYLPPANC